MSSEPLLKLPTAVMSNTNQYWVFAARSRPEPDAAKVIVWSLPVEMEGTVRVPTWVPGLPLESSWMATVKVEWVPACSIVSNFSSTPVSL